MPGLVGSVDGVKDTLNDGVPLLVLCPTSNIAAWLALHFVESGPLAKSSTMGPFLIYLPSQWRYFSSASNLFGTSAHPYSRSGGGAGSTMWML